MKTIKTILKELLKPPKSNKGKTPSESGKSTQPEISITENDNNKETPPLENDKSKGITFSENDKNVITNQNQISNETETNENVGDNRLDTPDTPEDCPVIQSEPGSAGESGKGIEERIREAYEKGVMDGRNQQIEEKFFPKYDGIPQFRGAPSLRNTSDDIFSIAREA